MTFDPFISTFILVYAAFKGLQDWQMKTNPFTWVDKYKEPLEAPPKGLYGFYHKINGLSYREKFLFSGTWLVSLSDWWHFFNLCRRITLYLLLLYLHEFDIWVIPAYSIGFAITYKLSYIFKVK